MRLSPREHGPSDWSPASADVNAVCCERSAAHGGATRSLRWKQINKVYSWKHIGDHRKTDDRRLSFIAFDARSPSTLDFRL
jgi:hypothetical protein